MLFVCCRDVESCWVDTADTNAAVSLLCYLWSSLSSHHPEVPRDAIFAFKAMVGITVIVRKIGPCRECM